MLGVVMALVLTVGAAAVLLVLRLTDDEPGIYTKLTTSAPGPVAPQPPARAPLPSLITKRANGLSVGITESNANILRPATEGDPFRRWQQALTDMRPRLYRLPVVWAPMQPSPDQPANLALPADGCARGQGPCGAFAGFRDELRALAARRAAGERFEVMVTIYWVPEWGAAGSHGCERRKTAPMSRPINERGLEAYKTLVAQVAQVASDEGVSIRYWSPWVEPNGAYFISPQREQCDTASAPVSAQVYANVARAMGSALEGVPGTQDMVVAEMAGVRRAGPRATGAGEFLRALPDDVVCSAAAISTHAYVDVPEDGSAPEDPLDPVLEAMDARECLGSKAVWITETGVGGPRAGSKRETSDSALAVQCRAYDAALRRWWENPRVTLALQYTLREDDRFPTGLADSGLTRAYPQMNMLRAWAQAGSTPGGAAPDPGAVGCG